jgi:ATP/maltotriose-dependent transcriptional regulator MalT
MLVEVYAALRRIIARELDQLRAGQVRLHAGLHNKLTLISAPAGFGKTTLLSEWTPHSERCVTWVSLDASDNDPTHFLAAGESK